MATNNNALFAGTNFQAADSPATHDVRSALGSMSIKTVTFLNSGPGVALIERSYDNGATFEPGVTVSSSIAITGGPIDFIDQLRVSHLGIDFDYIVVASASERPLLITQLVNPRDYFVSNYFSQILLDGANDDMAVDGSSTPVEYSYTVPTDMRVKLSRGRINIEAGQFFDAPDFGGDSALSNGLEASITPEGGSKQVMETWLNNRQMRATMPHFDDRFKTDGQYVGEWDFYNLMNFSGQWLNDGDKFSFLVQDDLQSLEYLAFTLYGIISDLS